ncbi:hypothetical protein BH23ACT5_BH23ACT5_10920 [soil metagenome]
MTTSDRHTLGGFGHLAARLVDVVTARALGRDERWRVRSWLATEHDEAAFFIQSNADQRHGYAAALVVESVEPGRVDLVRAALLHDIGKRHSNLGAMGRVCASLAMRMRLPLTKRWASYRDHGQLAAAELVESEPIVVEFARAHHGERPDSIPQGEWDLLVRADSARRGR